MQQRPDPSHQACLIRRLVSIRSQPLGFLRQCPDVGVDMRCAGGVQRHVSYIFKVSMESTLFQDVI